MQRSLRCNNSSDFEQFYEVLYAGGPELGGSGANVPAARVFLDFSSCSHPSKFKYHRPMGSLALASLSEVANSNKHAVSLPALQLELPGHWSFNRRVRLCIQTRLAKIQANGICLEL